MIDHLSPELRAVEAAVDSHFKVNPLVNERFAVACWTLFAVAEDSTFLPRFKSGGGRHPLAKIDNLVNDLNWSLRWLFVSCPHDGAIPSSFSDTLYGTAQQL